MASQIFTPVSEALGRGGGACVRVLACAHACGRRRVCLLKVRVSQWKDVITQSQAVGRGLGGGRGQASQGGLRLAPRPARGVKQRPGFRTRELARAY